MSYEPKEGVDYIIDLYAVAGAAPEANAILQKDIDRLKSL